MPYYCTVPRCTSMAGKAKNVSFHQFPRDEELARLWNDILKRGKPYTKYSKVCSLHFKPEDYTITSVGKNKGQWRTLRKDAVPSQNLPSETPAPYSRKQWESWSQNSGPAHVMDSSIQQQVAQAIYMQTMLAMQAAGTEPALHQNGPSTAPELPLPHTSNHEDILKGKQTNTDCTSYKCTECTKCFKDPDVFILHKRSHTKDIKSNGVEKENFNMNVTLRSNPILANLLKTNNEANFDPNIVTMENILMTALAANMDYLRSFSTVKDGDTYDGLNNDRGDGSHDRSNVSHDRSDVSHDRSDVSHDKTALNHDRSGLNHPRTDVNNAIGDLNRASERSVELRHRSDSELARRDATASLNHVAGDLSHDNGNLSRRENLNHTRSENNERESDLNHSRDDQNHRRADKNHSTGSHTHARDGSSNRGDLNRVSEPLSYAMDLVELNDTVTENKHAYNGRYYRERYLSTEFDNNENNSKGETTKLNDFRVRSTCDTELNESMDSNISNSLVIDESV